MSSLDSNDCGKEKEEGPPRKIKLVIEYKFAGGDPPKYKHDDPIHFLDRKNEVLSKVSVRTPRFEYPNHTL